VPVFFSSLFAKGPIAQLDRASDFESEGWAFESLWDRHALHKERKKKECFSLKGRGFSDGLIEAWANLYIEFELTIRAPLDRTNMQNEWLGHSRNSDGVNGIHFIVAAVCSNAKGGNWESI
tara:strand:+ start:619 stop:981 length:363 start_codon:yes stop_codon:yes gene_type:complete